MPAVAAFEAYLREHRIAALPDRPLAPATTFRIGGPARWLVRPSDAAGLSGALAAARECDVPVKILGGGSNLLVGDAGVDGAVFRLADLRRVSIRPSGEVEVEGGVNLPGLVRATVDAGLAGLEGLAGIPGSVAGALVMNAGGKHSEICSAVRWVDVLEPDGSPRRLSREEAGFRYRGSELRGRIVVGAGLRLEPGDRAALRARHDSILADKRASQPMGRPNAGCIFKNPPGERAGRLIDGCGLKGAREGGASVSTLHANFILNEGRALAADVLRLVDRIRDAVRSRAGLELELEILTW